VRGNSLSRHKECVSELSVVRREIARRAYQVNSQAQGEISRWLSTLERNTMREKTQLRVTEHSETLCQEGINLVQVCKRTTQLEMLESLRESQNY
jgi:hypothetical protein